MAVKRITHFQKWKAGTERADRHGRSGLTLDVGYQRHTLALGNSAYRFFPTPPVVCSRQPAACSVWAVRGSRRAHGTGPPTAAGYSCGDLSLATVRPAAARRGGLALGASQLFWVGSRTAPRNSGASVAVSMIS